MSDDGPAFPTAGYMSHDKYGEPCPEPSVPGMSLRDWFAGQALIGLIGLCGSRWVPNADGDEKGAAILAETAYTFADAMIRAREKKS